MFSVGAYSEYAYADGPAIDFTAPALIRLATARTANPIVFLELDARENTVTTLEEIVEAAPGLVTTGYSMVPYSAIKLPRTERATVSFLFATRPWVGGPTDATRPNTRALPRLITGGRISRTAPVEATASRRGQRTIGDARIANADGALDYLLTDYTLQGGQIRAWLGEPQDASENWALLYEAEIESVEATRTDIIVNITTIADELKRSLQTRRYTGGGGLSGDASVAGRLRPTCWGECFGVDPVLISEADRIYQVHDSSVQDIEWVREGGLDYDFTADYPTYATLALATLASGEYATCRAYGLFRIGTTLEGLVYPIRAGVKGDNTGNGYVSATGDILYRVARNRAFLTADQVGVSGFNALPRGRVGYYTNGSTDISIEQMFDDLLGGVVAIYGVGREAELTISRMLPADLLLGDLTVNGEQLFDVRVETNPYTPRIKQPYTYAPTIAPLTTDQISPEADGSVAARMTTAYSEGEYYQATEAAIPPIASPTLTTYFVSEESALQVAEDALVFSARNPVPLSAELGRIGLLADIGKVLAVERARFATDFRGVVYEQEDNLGAAVTSKVVALG